MCLGAYITGSLIVVGWRSIVAIYSWVFHGCSIRWPCLSTAIN